MGENVVEGYDFMIGGPKESVYERWLLLRYLHHFSKSISYIKYLRDMVEENASLDKIRSLSLLLRAKGTFELNREIISIFAQYSFSVSLGVPLYLNEQFGIEFFAPGVSIMKDGTERKGKIIFARYFSPFDKDTEKHISENQIIQQKDSPHIIEVIKYFSFFDHFIRTNTHIPFVHDKLSHYIGMDRGDIRAEIGYFSHWYGLSPVILSERIYKAAKKAAEFPEHKKFADILIPDPKGGWGLTGVERESTSRLLWMLGYSVKKGKGTKKINSLPSVLINNYHDRHRHHEEADRILKDNNLAIVAHGLFPAFPLR